MNWFTLRLCVFARVLLFVTAAESCPFCSAVKPSFAERRAECAAAIIGEITAIKPPAISTDAPIATFRVHQVLKGRETLGDLASIDCDVEATFHIGDTALLLGDPNRAKSWQPTPVDESSLAYFVRLPDVKSPWDKRLRYAAKFLEHDDPQVADDAFRTFAPAPFDAVAAIADAFDFAQLRTWLVEPSVPDERKGFYGMLLGLADRQADRTENLALLNRLAFAPASDFRAGYDGILGGLLWAEGNAALDRIDDRILRNPAAAEGDVRHAQTAIRFDHQYGHNVDAARWKKSLTHLLDHPATAPGAIQDLTRAKAWEFADRTERLFRASPDDDPMLDRAVVGYLLVSPKPEATAALRRLREAFPRRVEEAENFLALSGVRGSS